jgi:peptidoglycan/LPS O-acetylase OafA/YrhL
MVYLFIMVSGFSLAHSELSRRQRGQRTTLYEFLRRRAWRIMPTYYTAIAVSLVAASALERMARWSGLEPPTVFHQLSMPGVIAHLVFLHTSYHNWMFQIEPPLWSIATEVQLYFLFPALIGLTARLPWPLAGLLATAPAWIGWALGWRPPLLGFIILLDLLVWFVIGILAAKIVLAWQRIPHRVLLVAAVLCVAEGIYFGTGTWRDLPAIRAVWAFGFACALIGLYGVPHSSWNVLAWPAMRRLGSWSYSLYVIHFPILVATGMVVSELALPAFEKTLAGTVIGAGAAVLAARLLYQWVELPSLRRVHRRPS